MAEVKLVNVRKVYDNGFCALNDLSLSIADGEFLVLVGPSGCGKSTALQMIAGLESITAGQIYIGERVVNDEPPKSRDIAMVFQDYALYPYMTVAKNIGFPLELAKMKKADIKRQVTDAARILGLEQQLDKRPGQLSGGQKQRVAMGRAIVRRPAVFLMDEPLSNLDAKLRVQMRGEISRIQAELGTTTIYVTHDQVEAMTMGDRVAVMLDGELQQVDTPQRLYANPANLFVAGFIGSPPMNLFRGQLVSIGNRLIVTLGSTVLALDNTAEQRHPGLAQHVGESLAVGIRPECVALGATDNTIIGVARLVESLGAEVFVHVEIDAAPLRIADATRDDAREELGGTSNGAVEPTLIARLGPDTLIGKGETVHLGVDVTKLHFFDPSTGDSLTRA